MPNQLAATYAITQPPISFGTTFGSGTDYTATINNGLVSATFINGAATRRGVRAQGFPTLDFTTVPLLLSGSIPRPSTGYNQFTNNFVDSVAGTRGRMDCTLNSNGTISLDLYCYNSASTALGEKHGTFPTMVGNGGITGVSMLGTTADSGVNVVLAMLLYYDGKWNAFSETGSGTSNIYFNAFASNSLPFSFSQINWTFELNNDGNTNPTLSMGNNPIVTFLNQKKKAAWFHRYILNQ